MRRWVVGLAVLTMMVAAPLLAAEGGGSLEGRLLNKTGGGGSVAGTKVTLHTYLNGQQQGQTEAKTDEAGRFRFEGLATGSGFNYQIVASYQGVDYNSELVALGDEAPHQTLEIAVYDATEDDSAIKVEMAHLVAYVEEGSLLVGEFYRFVNQGDKTYVGTKVVGPAGQKETLRFALPAEATQVELRGGLMECCAFSAEPGLVDTMGVEPGAKEVSFAYRVPLSSGELTLSRTMEYPTDRIDLFISGEGVKVQSDELTFQGMQTFQGQQFQYFSATDLARGDSLTLNLGGLPSRGLEETIPWAVLGLGALGLAGGALYAVSRHRQRPVPAPVRAQATGGGVEVSREALLLELADLDDQFEAGALSEADYRRRRAERKSRLLALMSRSSGRGGASR